MHLQKSESCFQIKKKGFKSKFIKVLSFNIFWVHFVSTKILMKNRVDKRTTKSRKTWRLLRREATIRSIRWSECLIRWSECSNYFEAAESDSPEVNRCRCKARRWVPRWASSTTSRRRASGIRVRMGPELPRLLVRPRPGWRFRFFGNRLRPFRLLVAEVLVGQKTWSKI